MPIRRSSVRSVATTSAPSSQSYSTTFPVDENPLSESGNWTPPAPTAWTTRVRVVGGIAYGDPASTGTNDSVMVLVGSYGPTQTVICTVNAAPGYGSGQELEIHLRLSFTSTTISTYECDISPGNECSIVKWHGAQGTFNVMPFTGGTAGSNLTGVTVQTGDQFKATVVTNGDGSVTVKVFYKPVAGSFSLIAQTDDDGTVGGPALLTGNPGIGFDNVPASTLGWDAFDAVTS